MKRILTSFILLVFLTIGAASALAEPVQEFNVQLKDITPDGRYTVVFTSNSFDTTGDPPPAITSNSVRFAKGITIKPKFLKRGRLCDHKRLKEMLIENQTVGFQYKQMLDNLKAAQKRLNPDLTPANRKLLDTCRKAFMGKGRVVVDVRPLFPDPIPAFLYMFVSPPTEKGAIGGFGIMSVTDRSAPIVRNNELIAGQKPLFTVNLFNEPTPDGLYGYRLKLPPGNIGLIKFSVAELRVESTGIVDTTEKRTCVAKRAGRCTKFKVKKTNDFWATPPDCPASGRLQFQADYTYETGLVTNKTIQVPCPRFSR